jgi:flagellar basal body P-ring protein FlgI
VGYRGRKARAFPVCGANPSVSSNGNLNGIVWALSRAHTNPVTHVTVPAALHAFNAANLSAEIYNSSMNNAEVLGGDVTTFTLPTIANGKVYATVNYHPTAGAVAQGKLYLFGLLPTTR